MSTELKYVSNKNDVVFISAKQKHKHKCNKINPNIKPCSYDYQNLHNYY